MPAHQSYHLWKELAWGGGRSPRSLCLLQASIFLTPGSQTPPGLSCLPPSSALMDVSGWMGPPWPPAFLASLQQWPPSPTPIPAGPNLRAESPEHPRRSGIECVWFQSQGTSLQAISPIPCLLGAVVLDFLSAGEALAPQKRGSYTSWVPIVFQILQMHYLISFSPQPCEAGAVIITSIL